MKKRIFQWGGVAASVMLMAFGVGALVIGIQGRCEVRDKVAAGAHRRHARHDARADQEGGTGGEPARSIALPTCSVADQTIDTGAEAKCFASYMRIHALEATGGKTYARWAAT